MFFKLIFNIIFCSAIQILSEHEENMVCRASIAILKFLSAWKLGNYFIIF